MKHQLKIIAHRGASGITGEDNTLKSFRTSWMMGCDMVEFDIRLCKSGEILCFHDDNINEIPVLDLTHSEMKQLSGCNIPTFEETILECKDRIILDVEIKDAGYEEECLAILKKHLTKDAYIIKSFKVEVVQKIAELDDSVRRGLILSGCEAGEEEAFISRFSKEINHCKPHFICPQYTTLEPWFLKQELFQKYPFLVWTVNNPVDMQKLISLNVEGVITDRPDYLFEIVNRPKKNLDENRIKKIAPGSDSSNMISLLENSKIADREIKTKHVRIGSGVVNEVADWVQAIAGENANIVIISDKNTEKYSKQIASLFSTQVNEIVLTPLKGWEKITPHSSFCDDIAEQAKNADILISCGSGTINDLTKFAANKIKKPYISCATAASMNGYTSSIAALLIDGLKSTVNCHPPIVLLADTAILKEAPKRLAISGYSDLLSKPLSTADWLMSHIIFDIPYDDLPSVIVNKALQKSIEVAEEIKEHQPEALEYLMECLVLSGFAMSLAGSSAPASGGEHLISHYLDMKNYAAGKIPALHGEQVGIGTLISAIIYEEILKLDAKDFESKLKSEDVLESAHQELWEQIKNEALQQVFDKNEAELRLKKIKENWHKLLENLKDELWNFDKVKEFLLKGGAEINPEKLGINREWLKTAILHASEIRNRFTILHLASEIGLLDEIHEHILNKLN